MIYALIGRTLGLARPCLAFVLCWWHEKLPGAVLFDLDETLFDRTTSLLAFLADQYRRFADRLGDASFQAWCDRFIELDLRGHTHKSIVYPAILAHFGGDPEAASSLLHDYRERCRSFARGFPGMSETLIALRQNGLRLGIVTNGETEFQTHHINALGLGSLVDAILISQTEGLRKPDAALFLRAAARLKIKPTRCLFVGDNPAVDILGAHAAGMPTVWFRGGAAWPDGIASMPGAAIDALPELLGLVRPHAEAWTDRI